MAETTTNKPKESILDRVVDIEPSGVIYSLKGSTIEEFVEKYLEARHVNGVMEVKVHVRSEGRTRPEVAVYLFLNQNSDGISSQMQNVPAMLRNKMSVQVNMKLKDDFKRILYPLCGEDIKSGEAGNSKKGKKEYYVKLDIFRVVGIMFSVKYGRHSLVITDAKNFPDGKDCIISVVKNELFGGFNNNNTDNNRARQIEYLEKRR